MSPAPEDPALVPTGKFDAEYDEVAIKRARELLTAMPENVGPYRILERIGGGGMGDVYRAEQRSPIRRQVALKFIKLGMDSKAVITRFEAERQALALMDHPHIAKVFDAGTDDTGRPYFVMEYVKGKSITDYADQNHLTIPERLKLFEQVCQAVQHAHHKGVIHRDLKPGNVLVSTQDDEPFAKVIDFGVAKAISQNLTDGTLFTQHDQFIGTPQYMSPEQAGGSVDIDTRTDVYSLGVLLYELLTGSTPFSTQEIKAAAFEQIKKMIIESDPPKPSTRLSPNTPTLSSLATFRRTEPKRLGMLVQGELDWIVMKSIDKDRRRRYETPTSLANDILAHLKGEPVQAAPPSTAYRIQKFVRRNRGLVIGTAAVMAALLIGVCGTTWGLIRARIAEQAAIDSERIAINSELKKEQQRKLAEAATQAESEQRSKAERQLVSGILRPIGFNDGNLDPAELRSLIDLSALSDSRLQLLALEVAFENPDTALRVARRAERVIQSCIGLSPQRRAKVIELVSVKQRDMQVDPRIRVAACWLALEIGTADLPACAESINYLSDPAHKSSQEFEEFVEIAVSRNDSRQQTVVNRSGGDALVVLLEKSSDYQVLFKTVRSLIDLAPRMAPEQVTRSCNALIARLKMSKESWECDAAVEGLVALAPRLDLEQISRGWDALIAMLENSLGNKKTYGAGEALFAMGPRLAPERVTRQADTLIRLLERSAEPDVQNEAAKGIAALAPRLESAQVKRGFDALISSLEKSNDTSPLRGTGRALIALAPRLAPEQITSAWNVLVALLEESRESRVWVIAGEELAALAPFLPKDQHANAWDALIAVLEKTPDTEDQRGAGDGLFALAPRLAPELVASAWNDLIEVLENTTKYTVTIAARRGLAALVPRLAIELVTSQWDTMIVLLEKSTNYSIRIAAAEVLIALTPRLVTERGVRKWDMLIELLDKHPRDAATILAFEALFVLAPQLAPEEIRMKADRLISVLERSNDGDVLEAAGKALAALSPRLTQEERVRAVETLFQSLQKTDEARTRDELSAIVRSMEDPFRDRISANLIEMLLDLGMTSSDFFYRPVIGQIYQAKFSFPVEALSNPKSLAKLLSHPNCAGDPRDAMLQRFEELVFYNGQSVYLKTDVANRTTQPNSPDSTKPPRRFHNLHDVATWIQQNWPDFDLETNHPVTWRGEAVTTSH